MISSSTEPRFQHLALEHGPRMRLPGLEILGLGQGALGPFQGTLWGLLVEGRARLCMMGSEHRLRAGQFFAARDARIEGEAGTLGFLLHQPGYPAYPMVGGPLEDTGRLRYIDGCSDTLLVCPPRRGEPCLNHLHIPAGTLQTPHVHPSDRIGVIVRGEGQCETDSGLVPLRPGLAWVIPAGLRHRFRTGASSLDVLAWHPDSDFGPTDEDHPMINRTWASTDR